KLKRVMQEIKDILSREDIAGIVVIHEPGYSEQLVKLDPTYSCAKIKGNNIEFKGKKEHYGGDTKRRDKVVADTANMFHHLNTGMGGIIMPLIDLEEQLNEKLNPDHSGGGFTDHNTQNN
ncbi:MAG TPA: hypothetical protein PKA53_02080, partial [Sphingobacterium sp.]|nr:hypothetical protein [Sphingobacterium sp.]